MEQQIKTRQASDFASSVDARIAAATSTVVQPLDATLTAIAAIATASDKLIYATGSDTFATTTITAAARSLLDDADSATMLLTLGAAPLASPTFTGVPAGPTASLGTNTTQFATTAFVQSAVSAATTGVLEFISGLDCSANPNYPAASKGDLYYVTVAGKIGGASGVSVDVGDAIVCKADNAGGTQSSVGSSWFVLEHNLAGALLSANNLSDLDDTATARSNLGLVIGTNVQAYSSALDTLSANGSAYYLARANHTGTQAWSTITSTPSTLSGYGITDAQGLDATLTAFAALTIADNSITVGTGADAFSQTSFAANTFPARASTGNLVAKDITDFGLSLVDDADAAAARTTLGLGTMATEAAASYLPLAGGTMTGALTLDAASLLQFGGTTSSYPALKRSSTELQVRLADDSEYATSAAGCFTSHGSILDPSSGGYWMLRHRNSDGGAYWGFSQKYGGTGDIQVWISGAAKSTLGAHMIVADTGGGFSWSYGPGAFSANLSIIRDTTDVVAIYGTTNAALRLYGAYTDASNYVRASLAATSTSVTLAAQTAGTGADNISIAFTPAGTGVVGIGGLTSSYPALKRSGTELQVRLADDSDYAPFKAYEGMFIGRPYQKGLSVAASTTSPVPWSLFSIYNETVTNIEAGNWGRLKIAYPSGKGFCVLSTDGAGSGTTPGFLLDTNRTLINGLNYKFSIGYSTASNQNHMYLGMNSLDAADTVCYIGTDRIASTAKPHFWINAQSIRFSVGAVQGANYAIYNPMRLTAAGVLEFYGASATGWTDASNYVRLAASVNSTAVTLAAQTAGTGADDVDMILSPAGAGNVGIGTDSPTAYLDLPASTTSAASLRIRTGTAPTSPNSGDVWHDSTQQTLSYYAAGVAQTVNGVMFTQTETVTVANTVTETDLNGTGTGTLTLPANFFSAGKTVRIRALGYHSSTASPDITIRIKLGSTTILTTGAITSGNGTDEAWICEATFSCRTTGSTGTIIGQGRYEEAHGNGVRGGMVNTATTTIDTTESQAITITVEWGTADAVNTISCTNLIVEILN